MPNNDFVRSSSILFFDYSIVNFGNLVFWLLLSQFVLTSELGEAVTVVSIVMLIATIIQLGIEYPLLKNSSIKPQFMVTALVFELIIAVISIPILLYVMNVVFDYGFELTLIAIAMLIVVPSANVLRFSLLGVSNVKKVLIIFAFGTGIKLLIGIVLASSGLGSLGILLAFLSFAIAVLIPTLYFAGKRFGFRSNRMVHTKEVVQSALVNAPIKVRPITRYLIIFLLPFFGIIEAEIGIFYMALVIAWAAGSLANSMAFMVIPASTKAKTDLSAESLRFGLSLTVPLTVALMVAPDSFLSIIGSDYSAGGTALFVLATSIIPQVILANSVARFNNLGKTRELFIVGLIHVVVLITTLILLVPIYGSLGAAFSVLVASVASVLPALIWSDRKQMKFITISILSIAVGWLTGNAIIAVQPMHILFAIIISMIVSFLIILATKTLSLSELREALNNRKRQTSGY